MVKSFEISSLDLPSCETVHEFVQSLDSWNVGKTIQLFVGIKAKDLHARVQPGLNAKLTVFDNGAMFWCDSQGISNGKEQVRARFPDLNIVGAKNAVRIEEVEQSRLLEAQSNFLLRSVGGDGARDIDRR